jgi:hypothetical protein
MRLSPFTTLIPVPGSHTAAVETGFLLERPAKAVFWYRQKPIPFARRVPREASNCLSDSRAAVSTT